jgi:hypothetical protein
VSWRAKKNAAAILERRHEKLAWRGERRVVQTLEPVIGNNKFSIGMLRGGAAARVTEHVQHDASANTRRDIEINAIVERFVRI